MEKMVDEGLIPEGTRILLPPRVAPAAVAAAAADTAAEEEEEEEAAVVIADGQLLLDGKVYDSVEDVLEAHRGLKLNKREKKGWVHMRVREGREGKRER